ncbi:MAG: FkbM family methyltransferase [Proteobacteria bacterium]|nr:FkbM family methyltransferase [Pseudomonadota bacterium]MBS0546217.1 FkbM family methyltransferase [Pseudomonadota bacterium]
MPMLTVNLTPLMTTFLVGQGAFRDDPVVLMDVGARGGIGREWEVFGDQVRAYCFEPDEAECRRLSASAPSHLIYIPRALGRTQGRQVLYHTALPDSAGLYKTRMEYFNRLLNRDNAVTVRETELDVISLDEAILEFHVPAVDFIKLDIEGAELDVLESGSKLFERRSPLGLLSEVRLHEEINGSPSFARFDAFLQERGLRVYDLQFYYQSRIAMPYPGLEHYRRPNGDKFFAYTSRGQLQDGDALYFRDLLLPVGKPAVDDLSPTRILKMCAFLEIFSMNDCAAELMLAAKDRLAATIDVDRLLDLLASGVIGEPTTFKAYTERYFQDPTPIVGAMPSMSDKPVPAARGWLSRVFAR